MEELRPQAEHLGATYGVDIYLGGDINNCSKDIYEYKVSNNTIRIEKMLNPDGFEYDFDYKVNEENVNYDYTINDMEHECYFADIYCKSFPNEDRARIMEFAMLDDGDERKSRIKEAGIQAKLKYICEQSYCQFVWFMLYLQGTEYERGACAAG